MAIVIILNKNSQEILRAVLEDKDTIETIQKKICRECPESVCLTQNSIPLDYKTSISELGNIVLLVLEKEIEFNNINFQNIENDKSTKINNNNKDNRDKDNNNKDNRDKDNRDKDNRDKDNRDIEIKQSNILENKSDNDNNYSYSNLNYSIDVNPIDVNPIDVNPIDVNTIDDNTIDVNTIDINTIDVNPIDANNIDVNTIDVNTIDANTIDVNTIDAIDAIDDNPIDAIDAIDYINIDNNTRILYQGKIYNVIKRRKRWNLRNITDWAYNSFSFVNTFQFIFVSSMLLIGDFFMPLFIGLIYLLDYFGFWLKNNNIFKKIRSKNLKLVFMFLTSLLLKDHQNINVIDN